MIFVVLKHLLFFAVCLGQSRGRSVLLALHGTVARFQQVILVTVVNFREQSLVIDTKQLVLQQCHVRLLVLLLREGQLRARVIANQLILFPLLIDLALIDCEQLNFSLQYLCLLVCLFLSTDGRVVTERDEAIALN